MSVHHTPNRKSKPWVVRWRDHDGRNRSKSFDAKHPAEAFDRKRREKPVLIVQPEVRRGRLVRVCPACQQEITEHTDADGMVSNHFGEHYAAEHSVGPKPEKRYIYVVAGEWKTPHMSVVFNQLAIDTARETDTVQGEPVEWMPVDRLDDLPDDGEFVQAYEIARAAWAKPEDEDARKMRIYRMGPFYRLTKEDHEAHKQTIDRLWTARRVLIDRHEDELPQLEIPDEINGNTEAVGARVDAWLEARKPVEAEIAKDLDVARELAYDQFFSGQPESVWRSTIDEAIAAASITGQEILAERKRSERLLAETETKLQAARDAS